MIRGAVANKTGNQESVVTSGKGGERGKHGTRGGGVGAGVEAVRVIVVGGVIGVGVGARDQQVL